MAATTRSVTAESRRRRAWLWRILECVLVTVILLALIATPALTGMSSVPRAMLTVVAWVLAIGVGIYWMASTTRLLRFPAAGGAGFLALVCGVATAVAGGPGAILMADGRTAICRTVSVAPMTKDMSGRDWRHQLLCPDGTTLTVVSKEADDPALRAALVYHPRGWVDPQPAQTYRSADYTLLRWTFLGCAGLLLAIFLAAVVSGIIRRSRTTEGVDDRD